MSIKATSIIGHKIVTLQKGEEVDSISEIIFDPFEQRVVALLVDKGGWFSDAKVILMNDVESIGKDAVIIKHGGVIHKASEVQGKIKSIAKGDVYLTQSNVITQTGDKLGKVTDIYFDLPEGNVTGLEVSEGLVENIKSSKKFIDLIDIITVGDDAIIVQDHVVDKFAQQAQEQGLQGTVNQAKDKTSQAAQSDQANKMKDKVSQAKDYLQEKAAELKDYVQSGQAHEDTKSQMDKLREKSKTLEEKAGEKLQSAKGYVEDKSGQAKGNVQDNRKNSALGKFLTTNLVDGDDIFANIGDIVTQSTIDRAETAGVLENLLNNLTSNPVNMENTR